MEKEFICNADYPVVNTVAGKLRGFYYDGLFQFRGIKYADAKRFRMPEPVAPWEGVKDAIAFGYNAPNSKHPRSMPTNEVLGPQRYWPSNEHCQYLNVWTDTLDSNAKKAVMVWIHGGGYLDGSAIEQDSYLGDSLAKYNDVVVVSLNHRLGVFGHLDMSPYGPEYENSRNVGFADIVAALQWIHENIEQFGGDPERVCIFGQSGGGGKVSALMQIPSAEGLFQRAIIMSGIITDDNMLCSFTADPKEFAEEIMKEMGLRTDEMDRFLTSPEDILVRAAERAQINLGKRGFDTGWGPKVNGWYTGSLCLSTSTGFSKHIPTIVGTCFSEFAGAPNLLDKEKMTEEEKLALAKERFGDAAEGLLERFRTAYPHLNTAYATCTDTFFRKDTMEYTLKKAAESDAPVYNYVFALPYTVDGGTPAMHGADIAYGLHNADRVPAAHIPGVSDFMNEAFSNMYTTFAKTGDPNTEAFPHWDPCTGEHLNTMIFDKITEQIQDHDKELVDYIIKNTPAFKINFHPEEPTGEMWKY